MSLIVYAILAALAIFALAFILWNFHRQKDFEGTDHVVPEDYD